MHDTFLHALDLFARGGGGGSGGGGSGGGGEIIALIGYFPSYYLGKLVKKLLPRKAELIVSASFASLFSILIFAVGIFGGFLGGYVAILVIIGIWAGWAAAFFGVWDRLKQRSQKAKQAIQLAGQTDSAWNEQALLDFSQRAFLQFQADWSSFNLTNMATYLTPNYARHNALLLQILREQYRTNLMSNVQIKNCLIIDIHDDADNSKDSFTVAFEASAVDQLIDNTTNSLLFQDTSTFTEYWTFVRSGSSWLLDHINQQTADMTSLNQSLYDFAARNSMFYSLDMGWLFLPRKGVLFSGGKFGVSDINNHVVGTYNGHLTQFYTYVPFASSDKPVTQLVAQINLPKSYGGIVIRPDKNFFQKSFGGQTPKGYQKYEFEWPDFNKRYDVFATDADRLATFELLNPGFMAYLYDNDPGVTIEVTDNIVYLHKQASTIQAADYEKMLTILMRAFKELKL